MREDTSPPPEVDDASMNGNNYTLTATNAANKRHWLKQQSNGSQGSGDGSSPCLSHDSSTDLYTDSTGIDLEQFIIDTLHKNQKDRHLLIRIEQELCNLVRDNKRTAMKFPQMSSYQRMLVHRVAAYFGMDHNVDSSGSYVIVNKTKSTRLPEMKFKEQVKDELSSDEPKKLILKRESSSLDDSSAKTLDWQLNNDSRRSKSFEEREEEYERAKRRIFNQDSSSSQEAMLDSPLQSFESACDSSHLSSQEDLRWVGDIRPWSSTDSDSSSKVKVSKGHSETENRINKVDSFENRECISPRLDRPVVSKSNSFSGYPAQSNPVLRTDSAVSPLNVVGIMGNATRGKATSCNLDQTDTPSTTSFSTVETSSDVAPSTSPSVDQTITEKSCESSPVHGGQSNMGSSPSSSSLSQEASTGGYCYPEQSVVWAVTNIADVPHGSILINPQTGQQYLNADGSLYRYNPDNPPQLPPILNLRHSVSVNSLHNSPDSSNNVQATPGGQPIIAVQRDSGNKSYQNYYSSPSPEAQDLTNKLADLRMNPVGFMATNYGHSPVPDTSTMMNDNHIQMAGGIPCPGGNSGVQTAYISLQNCKPVHFTVPHSLGNQTSSNQPSSVYYVSNCSTLPQSGGSVLQYINQQSSYGTDANNSCYGSGLSLPVNGDGAAYSVYGIGGQVPPPPSSTPGYTTYNGNNVPSYNSSPVLAPNQSPYLPNGNNFYPPVSQGANYQTMTPPPTPVSNVLPQPLLTFPGQNCNLVTGNHMFTSNGGTVIPNIVSQPSAYLSNSMSSCNIYRNNLQQLMAPTVRSPPPNQVQMYQAGSLKCYSSDGPKAEMDNAEQRNYRSNVMPVRSNSYYNRMVPLLQGDMKFVGRSLQPTMNCGPVRNPFLLPSQGRSRNNQSNFGKPPKGRKHRSKSASGSNSTGTALNSSNTPSNTSESSNDKNSAVYDVLNVPEGWKREELEAHIDNVIKNGGQLLYFVGNCQDPAQPKPDTVVSGKFVIQLVFDSGASPQTAISNIQNCKLEFKLRTSVSSPGNS